VAPCVLYLVNPIVAAMIPTSLGLALLVSNVVALAAFLALVSALELQVRLVEAFRRRRALCVIPYRRPFLCDR
jgi:hypothetical protein